MAVSRRKKPTLIISWDTETDKVFDVDGSIIVRPYILGYCYHNASGDIIFNKSLAPHDDFFDFLHEMGKTYTLQLWAYNVNYDFPILYPHFLKVYAERYTRNKPQKLKYKISDGKNFVCLDFWCSRFSFRCYDASTWNTHIPSLDMYLKAIGKPPKVENFMYDKWNVVYHNAGITFQDSNNNNLGSSWDDEIEYLKRDVIGLHEVVMSQFESRKFLCMAIHLSKTDVFTSTSASFSKKLISLSSTGNSQISAGIDYFNRRFRPNAINEHMYNIMAASSCGGFTACNKNINVFYSPEGLIKSYDVNSMYPFVLGAGIPCGEISAQIEWDNYCTWYEIELTFCDWIEELSYISCPPLPSRWRRLDHTLFLLKEYYDLVKPHIKTDLKIVDTFYQEITKELRPVIWDLYQQKLQIEQEEDSYSKVFKKSNIKLILNSIYGKLAEKAYFVDNYYCQDACNFISQPIVVTKFPYTLSGVYVAQKSRTILIKSLLAEIKQGNIFLYSDTDSIKIVENKPPLFSIDPTQIGRFKLEGFKESDGYTHFFSTGKAKKYLMYHESHLSSKGGIKMALSGISGKTQNALLNYGDIDLYRVLFGKDNNILVLGGKIQHKRNKLGQMVLDPIDISLNNGVAGITHTIQLINKKWILKKI